MAYKISIITPVYNAEATLRETFESLKAQTIGFENIEYILVDDVSTDGSAALIDSWAQEYPNVTALHRTVNSGTAGAPRNDGMRCASAPYVMFVDNDDLLFPDACRTLYEAAEKNGADIVSGGFHAFADKPEKGRDPDKEVFRFTGLEAGVYDFTDFTHELCWTFCFSFWTKIYRRELIECKNILFSEGIYGEDTVFLHLYVAACRSGEAIKENIIDWRVREDSLSHSSGARQLIGAEKSVEYTLEKARESGVYERCCEILDLTSLVEYHTEWLLSEKEVVGEELLKVCESWIPLFKLSRERGFNIHSTYAKILQNDLVRGDADAAAYDAAALRELYFQRKAELDGIYSSRTWRLASALQKLLRRG